MKKGQECITEALRVTLKMGEAAASRGHLERVKALHTSARAQLEKCLSDQVLDTLDAIDEEQASIPFTAGSTE